MDKPEIIGIFQREGVELRQRGRSFWARCPFHEDRTPSLKVDPERQNFHCFSCQIGGDSITFIQKLHGLSFKDALKYLGIARGSPPTINHREKIKRDLLRNFGKWRENHYRELCHKRLVYEAMTRGLKTWEQVDRVASMIHELPIIEYHLDILFDGNDEEQYELYRERK